jgi:hypothetical protein
MPRYYHDVSHHHQTRFVSRFKKLFILLLLCIALIGLGLGIDAFVQQKRADTPSESTRETTSSYTTPIDIMRSQYFQFQVSNKTWTFVASESNSTKFVYRSFKKNLLEKEVVVTVNGSQPVPAATRLLPVEVGDDRTLSLGKVSDHCKSTYSANLAKETKEVTIENTPFLCDPNSEAFTVVVGLKSRGTQMKLGRPDGSSAVYSIYYRDVTISPSADELLAITNSFQTL